MVDSKGLTAKTGAGGGSLTPHPRRAKLARSLRSTNDGHSTPKSGDNPGEQNRL